MDEVPPYEVCIVRTSSFYLRLYNDQQKRIKTKNCLILNVNYFYESLWQVDAKIFSKMMHKHGMCGHFVGMVMLNFVMWMSQLIWMENPLSISD